MAGAGPRCQAQVPGQYNNVSGQHLGGIRPDSWGRDPHRTALTAPAKALTAPARHGRNRPPIHPPPPSHTICFLKEATPPGEKDSPGQTRPKEACT